MPERLAGGCASPGRRTFLAAALAALGSVACRRPTTLGPADASPAGGPVGSDRPWPFEVLDWRFAPAPWGEARCVVLVPRPRDPSVPGRLPLLVALHGAGETVDPRSGAHGWLDSYALGTAYRRLLAPPLSSADLQGLVTPARLAALNDALAARLFGGLVVACPYVPRAVGGEIAAWTFAGWLAEVLLPRLRRETPATLATGGTGIDGVSFGGALALQLGLLRPDLFGAIGSLQAALQDDDVEPLAAQVEARLAGRPLRLVTSTLDHFRPPTLALHGALQRRRIAHEFLMTEGPHGYEWNRGPGAVEMLLWHDRVLRRSGG
jgi:hypothetical protein